MEILKLKPVLKDYIWGGERLKKDFGYQTELEKVAEGWLLACHKDGKNIIENGKYKGLTLDEVIEKEGKEKFAGKKSLNFPYFPVLIKLIDAKDNLSVQVHPDNKYAEKVEHEFGKTEIWYVIDAAEDAQLIYGFKNKITSADFKAAIENNTLMDILNTVKVKKGDLFFIEAGTVHAIGKGVLIAEIQQNSNSTYRVYDYGRVGADGRPRELHIEKAVDVSVTEPPKHDIRPMGNPERHKDYTSTLLTKCELFTVNHYDINGIITLEADENSFNHIMVIDGCGKINDAPFGKGDSYYIPADSGKYTVSGNCEIIVTNI